MSQLSPSIQAILQLFSGPLAELRFADVDAQALADVASGVENAAAAVAEQEARLTELRQSLADRQEALLVLAQRALSYARVYAEHDPALSEQLSRISLPKPNKPRKPNAKPALAEAAAAEAMIAEAAAEAVIAEAAAQEAPAVGSATSTSEELAPSFEPASSEAAPRANKRRPRVAQAS